MILQSSARKYIKTILFLSVFFLIALAFSLTLKADEKNPVLSILPFSPVSSGISPLAPLVNPVFSDTIYHPYISYSMQNFEFKDNLNHNIIIDLAGFIFNYSRINYIFDYNLNTIAPSGINLFTFGKGFYIANILGFGLNYTFTKSRIPGYDTYKSLSLGLLFRPFRSLSFGYVSRDMLNPEINNTGIPRTDIYSVSIRPFSNITLSTDFYKYQSEKFSFSDTFFSADLRLKYDISLFAGISGNRDMAFGLSLPLGVPYTQSASLILDASSFVRNKEIHTSNFSFTLAGQRYQGVVGTKSYLKIILNDSINEISAQNFFSLNDISFFDILKAIERSGSDNDITAIILQIDNIDLGFAQVQEIREQIKAFRSRNKKAYAILNASGNNEYYLASACDEIYFSPLSVFQLTGLKAEIFFFKQGLDKIGIKFESVKEGKYKSFDEPFTREAMSPEFRENFTKLLTDLNDQFVNDITASRNLKTDAVKELFDSGFINPEEAVAKGFVDKTMYPINAEMEILGNGKPGNNVVFLDEYIQKKTYNLQWGYIPEIAVIHVSGSIVRGKSGGLNITPDMMGEYTYHRALDTAFKNPAVKAVIIRIDSGGGSAEASELMWHYLKEYKEIYKKPVIFSLGNTAASGGYYLACTGDKIIADRGSITGSIGVVTGKISAKELYKKLGINKEIIKMSEFADMFTESRDLTKEEYQIIGKSVEYIYERFLDKVAASRGISKNDAEKIAGGRVFTGSQAKDNNLIDEYGGLITAISMALKTAGIDGQYKITHLPEGNPFLDMLGLDSALQSIEKIKPFMQAMEIIKFGDENVLLYLPYKIVIY